jgi:hypothetical protein
MIETCRDSDAAGAMGNVAPGADRHVDVDRIAARRPIDRAYQRLIIVREYESPEWLRGQRNQAVAEVAALRAELARLRVKA